LIKYFKKLNNADVIMCHGYIC